MPFFLITLAYDVVVNILDIIVMVSVELTNFFLFLALGDLTKIFFTICLALFQAALEFTQM